MEDGVILVVSLLWVRAMTDKKVHRQRLPVLSSDVECRAALGIRERKINLMFRRLNERLQRGDVTAAGGPVHRGLFGIGVADHIGAQRVMFGQQVTKSSFAIV